MQQQQQQQHKQGQLIVTTTGGIAGSTANTASTNNNNNNSTSLSIQNNVNQVTTSTLGAANAPRILNSQQFAASNSTGSNSSF